LCRREPAPERLGLDVVGANTIAVDLDDRDQLAVPRLQLGVTVDQDRDELESELVAELGERGLSPIAEVAAFGPVEDDPRRRLRYG
jgi:hypothetical protein